MSERLSLNRIGRWGLGLAVVVGLVVVGSRPVAANGPSAQLMVVMDADRYYVGESGQFRIEAQITKPADIELEISGFESYVTVQSSVLNIDSVSVGSQVNGLDDILNGPQMYTGSGWQQVRVVRVDTGGDCSGCHMIDTGVTDATVVLATVGFSVVGTGEVAVVLGQDAYPTQGGDQPPSSAVIATGYPNLSGTNYGQGSLVAMFDPKAILQNWKSAFGPYDLDSNSLVNALDWLRNWM